MPKLVQFKRHTCVDVIHLIIINSMSYKEKSIQVLVGKKVFSFAIKMVKIKFEIKKTKRQSKRKREKTREQNEIAKLNLPLVRKGKREN